MGFFDNLLAPFSTKPAEEAAAAQKAGLNAGYDAASGAIGQGIDALKTNYTAGLQPFLGLSDTANAGVTQLKNVLGLNGPAGSDAAMKTLEATPGFQFARDQGNAAINAQAAATGMNASGNQLIDLSKFNQGLASQTYTNYVNSLMPFLSTAGNAAGGIGNIYTGLGNQLAGQYGSLANLGWQKETGIGNANANAELSAYNAGNNIWNAIGSLGGMKTSGGGTVGGNAMSGLGSAAMSLFSMFSDERLKEDIEQVGELYDGMPVYKYRYIGSPVFQIGLMAQDVEQVEPEAVTEIGGFKAVNYDKATGFAAGLARFLEAA